MTAVPATLASTINASATVILVLVTAVYAFLTWRMVVETRRARQQEVTPVFNLSVKPISIGAWAPAIENVGNGPALDVEATLTLEPGGEEHRVETKNIPEGDFAGSMNPRIGEDTHEEYDSLVVEGEYTDVFGERSTFDESYDLEFLAKHDGADSIMKRDPTERHVRRIEQHLKAISEGIEMDGLEKVLTMESRDRVLEPLREHEALTVRELASETGMTHFELAEELMWLNEAGAIEYDVERDEIFREEHLDVEIRLQDGGS